VSALRLGGLVQSLEALGAERYSFRLAILHNGSLLDVGRPAPVGLAVRVAHIVSELRSLAATLTFRHFDILRLPEPDRRIGI